MGKRFFLGIADNDRFASAVVGDLSGRIIATSVGGSVNHHYWGMEQARDNLQDLVAKTIGLDGGSRLAGACFTYKADFSLSDWKATALVSGLLEDTDVIVVDFASSSLLGMRSTQDRLLLVGGHSGLAICEDVEGGQFQIKQDSLMWNPLIRLNSKLQKVEKANFGPCLEGLQYMKSQFVQGKCMDTFATSLDRLVHQGSFLGLELAHDIAFDLVQMATSLSDRIKAREPTIGLYGQVLLGSETICHRVQYLLDLLFPHCQIAEVPLAPAKGAYLSSLLTRRSGPKAELISDI